MLNSSLDFLGNNCFILNSAAKYGGGIYARDNGIIYLSGSNSFQGNIAAERGGGIFVKDSSLIPSWTVSTSNATTVFVQRSLNLPGHSEFCNNSAMTGGPFFLGVSGVAKPGPTRAWVPHQHPHYASFLQANRGANGSSRMQAHASHWSIPHSLVCT